MVEDVPAAVGLLPVGGERGGLEFSDAVVDWDEHCEGEDDDENPDAHGDDERRKCGCVAAEDGFRDEQHQAEAVPERHNKAEKRGEEAEGLGLRLVIEFAHGGVDEDGDGELHADHEADGEDGDDIEDSHDCWYASWPELVAWWLLDGGGEEGLLGLAVGESIEGELAGGLGAEFEEEAGVVGGVGVYGVDGAELGGAV